MEAQSNLIPESASIRYARIWADFSAAVGRGESKTLSSYCRLTHTSYDGISITFPDEVNLSLQECSAESVADLLAIYRNRCGAAGGR